MSSQPPPDLKDWTWTIRQACAECGFDPAAVSRTALPARISDALAGWPQVLARTEVRTRPAPQVWSPLEYGAHVRDVLGVFTARLQLLLEVDDPRFDNWDQDAAAIAGDYAAADPAEVADRIAAATPPLVAGFAAVPDTAWQRRGLRSNGSEFTVETLGIYLVHDLDHHVHDVRV